MNKKNSSNAKVPKRLTKKQKDELLASQLPSLLSYHRKMLSDGERNKRLAQLLTKYVNSDTRMLDVGAGVGTWAILAAKLGAKRVVAVELEEALVPFIYKHAQENGVANRIEVFQGDCDYLNVKGKFNLIISEVFGSNALGEATIKSFVSIREKYLAPGGVLIPQKLSMLAVPARLSDKFADNPAELDLSCRFFYSTSLNLPVPLSIEERKNVEFLAEPKTIAEMDFRSDTVAPNLKQISVSWKTDNLSSANAFIVYNHHQFDDDLTMNSFDSPSWGATAYPFKQLEKKAGQIEFQISFENAKHFWKVVSRTENGMSEQSFSPNFPPVRIKTAQASFPRRKIRGQKK